MDSIRRLKDGELLAGLKRLVGKGRAVLVELLQHMGEVDARKLYRERAYASMFDYSVRELGMSEDEAFARIRVARAGRQFPLVLEMLSRGEVHLTGVKLLAPMLKQGNHVEVLQRARGETIRELEVLGAELAPKPDVPDTIRRLPEPSRQRELTATNEAAETPVDMAHAEPQPMPLIHKERAVVAPLSPGRFKVQFTAHQGLHDKLEEARDLMRHQVPNGDLATLVEHALDLLIAHKRKTKFAAVEKPRSSRTAPRRGSRHVPHEVKRPVVERDGARCTFVSDEGKRCTERGWLEFHHHQTHARGGPMSVANIALMCQAHNALLAERDYGHAFMARRAARVVVSEPVIPLPRPSPPARRASPL